jgi:hypothetical protein
MKKTATAPSATKYTASGLFTNQNGSQVEIRQDELGRLVGEFTLDECYAQHGQRNFTLSGFQTGNAVTFCVPFPQRESVTAWVGQFDKEGNLHTTWQMSIDCHTDAGKAWRATWTGADLFTPGERKPSGVSQPAVSHPFYCDKI